MKNKACEIVSVLFMVYVVGLTAWIVFLVFRVLREVQVKNPEDLPRLKPKTIIVSPHPDLLGCMYEIFLIPALIYPQVFCHPFKFCPYFTLDSHNFKDKWFWRWWLGARALPVTRGGGESGRIARAREFIRISRVIESGGVMIHFPGGGRECTGTEFEHSKGGKMMRKWSPSIGLLAVRTRATVVPIWINNGPLRLQQGKPLFSWPRSNGKPIDAVFGQPRSFPDKRTDPEKATATLVAATLELADSLS